LEGGKLMSKGAVDYDLAVIAERLRHTPIGRALQDLEPVRPLDAMIGRLDRILSEFLVMAADATLDEADRQTIKHHADDLIGVGNKALSLVKK
jgi:hypothetical protein